MEPFSAGLTGQHPLSTVQHCNILIHKYHLCHLVMVSSYALANSPRTAFADAVGLSWVIDCWSILFSSTVVSPRCEQVRGIRPNGLAFRRGLIRHICKWFSYERHSYLGYVPTNINVDRHLQVPCRISVVYRRSLCTKTNSSYTIACNLIKYHTYTK